MVLSRKDCKGFQYIMMMFQRSNVFRICSSFLVLIAGKCVESFSSPLGAKGDLRAS